MYKRTGNQVSASQETGPHAQEAGKKLEDPNWRLRPAYLPRLGVSEQANSNGPVTPQQSPVLQRGASPVPATNGHASPRFRFGVPSREYLSFAGPGGDDFAAGESLASRQWQDCSVLEGSAQHLCRRFCCTGRRALLDLPSFYITLRLVCYSAQTHWPAGYEQLFKEACDRLHDQGGVPVVIDFSSFAKAAGMLYTSAFLAERYAGIRSFLESKVGHQPASMPSTLPT